MNRLTKYFNYANSYLSNGDLQSITDSLRFIFLNKGASKTRLAKCYLGKMKIRKGTNDFQYINYYYEWNVKSFILANFNKYNVFIDIGAGIGDYSIMLANQGLKVIAFEAVNDNFKCLTENIKLNKLDKKIFAYNLAIGNEKEISNFIVKSVNTGASHRANIHINMGIKDQLVETVQIDHLDNLFPSFDLTKHDKILIKMDIEGMEIEALIGGIEFLREYDNITMIIETKHSTLQKTIETLQLIANFEIDTIDDQNISARKTSNIL